MLNNIFKNDFGNARLKLLYYIVLTKKRYGHVNKINYSLIYSVTGIMNE